MTTEPAKFQGSHPPEAKQAKDAPQTTAAPPKSFGAYHGSGQVAKADYSGPVGGHSVEPQLTKEQIAAKNKIIEESCAGWTPGNVTGPLHENVATGNTSGDAIELPEPEEDDDHKKKKAAD